MTEYVIDENVWVTADKPITELKTLVEVDCWECCLDWLKTFVESSDRLVVDWNHVILTKYFEKAGRLTEQWLRQLTRPPRERRLIELSIEWDEHHYAKVPDALAKTDPDDRKYMAVSLACESCDPKPPPIINATDTDWEKAKPQLAAAGLIIQELCPAYIKNKFAGREP